MTAPRVLLGDPDGDLVRRKIVVFKRLEPGDTPSMGSQPLKESPYLEGRILEIAIGRETHERMVALEKKRIATVQDSISLGAKYDVPGMLIAAGGGGLVGAFFNFLPMHLVPYLGGVLGLGVVLGFVTRVRKRAGEVAAEERWKAMPERKEYESLARELAEKWIAFSNDVKKDPGYHVELRLAEGSADPLRLASLDPRGFLAMPPTFDPEDFLPTEGAGVRYEVVHAQGEVVTRLLEGVMDSPLPGAKAKAKTEDAPAKSESDPAKSDGDSADGDSDSADGDSDSAKSDGDSADGDEREPASGESTKGDADDESEPAKAEPAP